MTYLRSTAILLLLAAAGAAQAARTPAILGALGSGHSRCPPAGFDSLASFDIRQFIASEWYVQRQLPLVYQPRSQLYCVRAQYVPLNASNPLAGLRVLNTANDGAVTGPVVGTAGDQGPRLIATVPDPATPSKLRVGFALGSSTRQLSSGPYWVVAAGVSADPATRTGNAYDWAIITGGAPRRPEGDGCATGSPSALLRRFQTNGVGLWLFSRRPVDTANTQLMLQRLAQLGLSADGLVPVQQEGCEYAGAGGSSQ